MDGPGATPVPATPEFESNPEARTMGMLCHLLAFSGYVVPFGGILGPLVLWLIKKDQMPFVDDQGKEAINFQITIAIALVVSIILIFVVVGLVLVPLVAIASIVYTIIAAVNANKGIRYRYPFAIRLIH